MVFHIKIDNKFSEAVSGKIQYQANLHQAETFSIEPLDSFKEDIIPPEPIIKIITGRTKSGVQCDHYELPDDGEPKLKFHITENGNNGCKIKPAPAADQHHLIQDVHFYENDMIVKQKDFFNPMTREAIIKGNFQIYIFIRASLKTKCLTIWDCGIAYIYIY